MIEQQTNKLKIINDPVYGFVSIPNTLIFDIIEHPYFQRLRRISQMGLSYMVYPGATHTRFHHVVGCMHLMQKVVETLRRKNIAISNEEANALYIAILLHDMGHSAFSHALEHSIVSGISHEKISLLFMKKLNKEFGGELSLAIKFFEGKYHRKFFCQLISGQFDIDRLDYLKRDSFYTGVTEGYISSDRLIAMMNVKNNELVIEKKGVYSVEKFLIARRLMYWQVYFHKTSISAETLLIKTLQRAKELTANGIKVFASSTLLFFLKNTISINEFNDVVLEKFSKLDDYDVLLAIKEWKNHNDFVLSKLSKMIINRELLKVKVQKEAFSEDYLKNIKEKFLKKNIINKKDVDYFIFQKKIKNQAYSKENPIKLLTKKSNLIDIEAASDLLSIQTLSKPVCKYYLCYPKKLVLP